MPVYVCVCVCVCMCMHTDVSDYVHDLCSLSIKKCCIAHELIANVVYIFYCRPSSIQHILHFISVHLSCIDSISIMNMVLKLEPITYLINAISGVYITYILAPANIGSVTIFISLVM